MIIIISIHFIIYLKVQFYLYYSHFFNPQQVIVWIMSIQGISFTLISLMTSKNCYLHSNKTLLVISLTRHYCLLNFSHCLLLPINTFPLQINVSIFICKIMVFHYLSIQLCPLIINLYMQFIYLVPPHKSSNNTMLR